MITKHLQLQLLLSPRSLHETPAKQVNDTRLEKYWRVTINHPYRRIYPFISRQQIFIIAHPRIERTQWVSEHIIPNGFIDELITDDVRLAGHVCRQDLPELTQMIQQSTLIGKQIVLQLHHIVTHIEL